MARLLRVEQRLTVDQLASRLALPRSTVYYWVRDLPLCVGEAREGIAAQRARGAGSVEAVAVELARGDRALVRAGGAPARKRSRPSSEAAYEDALRCFDDLAAEPTFRDFVCLYIVRGCARERAKVSLSDSDPAVIRLVNRWMLRLSDMSPLLSLRYEPGQNLTELRRFWGGIVGVEARAIRVHDAADRAGAHEPERRSRHGVLTVTVEDAQLRARLQAWIYKTRASWR